ncbi:MAG: accessory factor UbiK family protein [Pseudomonadota bacterium]|nr:accessory factor UbiK family protein [Pseudomonadota bacterium]
MKPDTRQLEELAARLSQLLPPSLKGLRHELEDNFRAVLRANLEKWDLVSRERFDVQAELLAKTQARLASMDQRLTELEAKNPRGS